MQHHPMQRTACLHTSFTLQIAQQPYMLEERAMYRLRLSPSLAPPHHPLANPPFYIGLRPQEVRSYHELESRLAASSFLFCQTSCDQRHMFTPNSSSGRTVKGAQTSSEMLACLLPGSSFAPSCHTTPNSDLAQLHNLSCAAQHTSQSMQFDIG